LSVTVNGGRHAVYGSGATMEKIGGLHVIYGGGQSVVYGVAGLLFLCG